MEKKKKIKIWGKIKLYETSAVGIAAYPDAHLSADSFSLIKALSESGDQLNLENDDIIMEKNEQVQDAPEEPKPEETPKEPEGEPEKEEEPEKPEEPAEEPEKSKPLTIDDLQKVVDGAMAKAMKGSETPRGLVFTEEQTLDKLKNKSIGELAIMQGAFKTY